MEAIKNWWMPKWNSFAEKHPGAAKWVREGGLFFLFSNLVTVWQYIVLQFLPYVFGVEMAGKPFSFPGIQLDWFGGFTWNVLGYDVVLNDAGQVVVGGGLGYTLAFLIATGTAQIINFPLQRNITFRSKGSIPPQILGYVVGWVLMTLVVNSINCVWVAFARYFGVPDFLFNIATIVLTGGVSMVIFFFVNKVIFADGGEKKAE